MKQTFINYKNYLFLKLSSASIFISTILFILEGSSKGHRGSTFVGMSLGIFSAIILLFLTWYGIVSRRLPVKNEKRNLTTSSFYATVERRKNRDFHKKNRSLNMLSILSAHIYLGISVLFIVCLHTGFRFHWNLHTLTFLTLIFVELTGVYGIFTYLKYPKLITENMGHYSLATLVDTILEIDQLCLDQAQNLPLDLQHAIVESVQKTKLNGTLLERLRGKPMKSYIAIATQSLTGHVHDLNPQSAQSVREVAALLTRKNVLLEKIWLEMMYKTRIKLWLMIHLPLAIVLMALLMIHVLSVTIFW